MYMSKSHNYYGSNYDVNSEYKNLDWDEKRIVLYLRDFCYISNKICREELKYGKTKSAELFKSLQEKGKKKKRGAGCTTHYFLKD